jgi:phosphoglycolate phosphatase
VSSSRKPAVIFDLDGTLLDTLQDLADSMNAVLASLGYPIHPVGAYRTFVGDGVTNLVKRALPASWEGQERREAGFLARCANAMREQYERRWAATTVPYAGIPELLEELRARSVPMAVLTNKPNHFAHKMVDHFLGASTFRAVLGAREGLPPKPDPAGARELLRALNVTEADTLYVGDSSTDMDTARNASLESIGVLWGFRGREELLEHGARHLVLEPREILGIFASR